MNRVDIPKWSLHNGVEIPVIGLGTYPMGKKEAFRSVRKAQNIGYRLFDTSAAYGNEMGIGLVLKKDSFIVTKISNNAQREKRIAEEIKASQRALRRTDIDLILLHWPYPEKYIESWKYLEEYYLSGKCRAIGVANFHQHHLEALLAKTDIAPMINQVEVHPMLSQKDLIRFCRTENIVVQAYSPFARMDERLFLNRILCQLSEKYQKEVTQVIMRWDYQNGIISIPKTSSPARMFENADIFDFELLPEEMEEIDSINTNTRVRYDPDNCDFDML